jgi:DNA replication protein DnaC
MELENTAKPIASILPQIGAMLERQAMAQTGAQSPENERRQSERQQWLMQRLQMKFNHRQLKEAVPKLTRFVFDFIGLQDGGVLIIHGPNGCGKTHLAKAIHRLFNANRFKIGPVHCDATTESESEVKIADSRFVHWPTVIDGIKKEQWLIFEWCVVEYLIVLDDIGAEHDPSGIGLEKLYLIINRRERKHTLITTNYPPSEWESKFERRIASRMFRNATHIDLSEVPDFNS